MRDADENGIVCIEVSEDEGSLTLSLYPNDPKLFAPFRIGAHVSSMR